MAVKVNVRKAKETPTTSILSKVKTGSKEAVNMYVSAAKTVARGARALGPKPINIGQAHNKKKK